MTTHTPLPRLGRRSRRLILLLVTLVVIIAVGGWVVANWTDWLWYREVGYTSVFGTDLRTSVGLFVIFGAGAAAWIAGNLTIAYRVRPRSYPDSPEQHNLDRYRMAVTPRLRGAIAVIAALTGLLAGLSGRSHLSDWLLFSNAQPFGSTDPQFDTDIGFYVFSYPFYRYLVAAGFTLVFVALLAALLTHWLFGGVRLSGPGDRITAAARAHLSVLVALFVGLKAVAYFLDQHGLLLGHNDTTGLDGAGYTAINALLTAKQILAWIAIVVAVAVLVFSNVVMRNLVWPGVSLGLLAIAAVTIGGIYPGMVSTFTVKPNIPAKEGPYIARSIVATRDAYGVDDVTRVRYQADNTTPDAALTDDTGTLPNVRLLDPARMPATFTQLQQVRGFYDFGPKLNVDRYTVDGRTHDYIVGVRQLDSRKLTDNQTKWQNRHTVFTHGYGFVAAPADRVCGQGQPSFVSGLLDNAKGDTHKPGDCYSGPDKIRVDHPQIYYSGQLTDFSIVGKSGGAPDREYDHPGSGKGSNNDVKNTYRGSGGVSVGSLGRRLLYGLKFGDPNFLLANDYFNGNSKLLYVRDPRDRVAKVAPFLTVDGDPYPAVVDGHVTWILDCYTTASTYPYAQRTNLQAATNDSLTGSRTAAQDRRDINYIRNSVKATVDAYTGKVTLYAFDGTDPVLRAWNAAYGGIVKPASAIPDDLAAHFRYPEDLFKVQRDILTKFHVTDPQEFNSQDNFWSVPNDPTRPGKQKQPPYYVVAQFPGQQKPTFQLTAALSKRKQDNLAGIMSASYDRRGRPRLSLVEMPGNATLLGPNQVQSKLRNQKDIRNDLNTSVGKNSEIDFGNLLTLPVAGGLLYVEPVYIKDRSLAYPLLKTVLVAYGGHVGYGNDLGGAIDNLVASANADDKGSANDGSTGDKNSGGTDASPGGGDHSSGNSDVDRAVRHINEALDELHKARKNDDYAAEGRALKHLRAATKEYERARKAAGAGSPSPSARSSGR